MYGGLCIQFIHAEVQSAMHLTMFFSNVAAVARNIKNIFETIQKDMIGVYIDILSPFIH